MTGHIALTTVTITVKHDNDSSTNKLFFMKCLVVSEHHNINTSPQIYS